MEKLIVIRFYHGSRRKYVHKREYKELGGTFGGHVVIQIDDFVYGFKYKDIKRIHIFPKQTNKNCKFEKQPLEEWLTLVEHKRVTNIYIPVTDEERAFLLNYFEENIQNPSCDYSFFGERCASNCYRLLKRIGKMSGGHYFFVAFYPGQFRRKLIKTAFRLAYRIEQFEGSETRVWEGSILD